MTQSRRGLGIAVMDGKIYVAGGISLRASYALPGTDLAHGSTRYSTDLAYGATSLIAYGAMGTDLAYGGARSERKGGDRHPRVLRP
eukprot:1241923-Rhodomonas_salina.2